MLLTSTFTPASVLHSLGALCLAAAAGAAHSAEYNTEHSAGHQAVSADAADTALAQGATVVDVRSAAAFGQGHLPGAVHWTLATVDMPAA